MTRRARVVIIGTGFSGLGMAIALQEAGHDDYIILEKADDVGGTWRENTYPGCACDVPSHMYSFSFEQNPGWTRMWSGQQEIWDYLERLTDKHDLRRHIEFGVEVTGARWDEDEACWHVETVAGQEYIAQFLVSGIGALHIPNVPELRGAERFDGTAFHSARWRHDIDLTGKRVAVIGTGASAIQIVPEIVDRVAELQLYQRTPPWVLPRKNFTIPRPFRWLFRLMPPTRSAFRDAIYWVSESLAIGFNGKSERYLRFLEKQAARNIARGIDDPELRRKLTPNYRIGCKRILGSLDYYPALNRSNATVITDGIDEVTPTGIVAGGVERPVDVIIYATGFHVTDAFENMNLVGRDGRKLVQEWDEHGIQTHMGITASGYPNVFFLLGPNTGLGHNSVVFMIEQQIKYVLRAMELADDNDARVVDVKQQAQDEFNDDIQRKLASGVWTTGGCKSWYLDAKGVNRTIWPGFTWQYWRGIRKFDPADFELTR